MMKTFGLAALIAITLVAQADPAAAAEAKRSTFGRMPDGREVPAVRLTNRNGVSANVIAYGASLQSMLVPDRMGRVADVTIGYADMGGYVDKPQYFGSTVGRFANRIARGRFSLDGRDYQVPVNNGANSLHGGTTGFDKVVWEVVSVKSGPTAAVTLRYVSPDGDQGYPGTMTAEVTYSLDEMNALTIEYRATTDKPTIVNLSNHAYWNLAGEGAASGAMGHVLTIPADTYLPTDAGAIPTGERASVRGTNFDFRTPRAIGDRVRDATDRQLVYGRGYDHNWIVGKAVTPGLHMMARVQEPVSGRGFELWSNQPGVQFYSGNFLDGTSSGKAKKILRMGDAIVLEPQIFPDSVNQRGFPEARLNPGQIYRNTIQYRFTGVGRAARR